MQAEEMLPAKENARQLDLLDPTKDDDYVDDGHCEDDDFNMDCDYDPEQQKKSLQEELIENSRDKRKRRKRRSKFMEVLKKEKPVFNPDDEKTYGQYIDEYYKLDYEDIIGDTPCRFKYVETVPNDFGLTVEEILLAKNKELNCWASLKKATQIRPEHVELNEVKTFKNKAQNEYLKKKILPSLYGEGSDDEDEDAATEIADKKPQTTSNKQTTITDKKSQTKSNKQAVMNKKQGEKSVVVCETNANKELNENHKKRKRSETNEGNHETIIQKDSRKTKTSKSSDHPQSEGVENDGFIVEEIPSNGEKLSKQKETVPSLKTVNQKSKPKKTFAPNSQKHKNKPKTSGGVKSTIINGGVKKKTKHEKVNRQDKASTYTKKPAISDERLRAFGLNPKKFHKKLKYGNKATTSGTANNSKVVKKTVKVDKLSQKKIKKKLLTVLGK